MNESKSGDSSLHDWFSKSRSSDGKPGWVQLGGKYAGKPCAKQPGQTTKPKCGSSKMKRNLNADEEERAFRRKNREDPNPNRKGKAKMVTEVYDTRGTKYKGDPIKALEDTPQFKQQGGKVVKPAPVKLANSFSNWRQELELVEIANEPNAQYKDLKGRNTDTSPTGGQRPPKPLDPRNKPGIDPLTGLKLAHYQPEGELVNEEGKKDACYHKVKSRYSVWPSAYASGALVKCRKVGAANWGTKSESFQYSNWREDFKALEIETIDLIKAEPLMNEGLAKAALIGGAALAGKVIYDRIRKSTDTHSDESIGQPTIQGAASAIRKRNEALNKLNQQLNQSHELEGEVVNEYKEGDKIEYSKDTQELINRANETSIQKLTRRARQTKNSIELKAPRNPLTLPEAKNDPCWVGYTQKGMKKKGGKMVPNCVKEGYSNWRQELDEDWQKVNKGDKTDGMSQKAVDAYKRENPGSKLKTAVTEKNPTGKRAERRKNFCSRSDGQRKMHNIDCSKTPDKAICKARKRWRC